MHTPVASVHVSVEQTLPSEHVEKVAQTPTALHRPQPATDPSLHVVVVGRGLHATALVVGVHTSHGFAGLPVPAA